MCIICLEFQKHRDFADARRMINAARKEPNSIDADHLDRVEKELNEEEKKENG
jgi:hypothetical protein